MIQFYYNIPVIQNLPISIPPVEDFTQLTSRIDGLQSLTLTATRNEENHISRLISTDLKFYGKGYEIILDTLITQKKDFIIVKLIDDCCDEELITAVIRRDEVKWCSQDCCIEAKLVQADDDTLKIDSLDNLLIWDDEFIDNINDPNFSYGSEDDFPPQVLFYWNNSGVAERFKKEHTLPCVYARDYFINSANKIGATFDSTIFNAPNGLNSWTGDNYDIDTAKYNGGNYLTRHSNDNADYLAVPIQNGNINTLKSDYENPYYSTVLLYQAIQAENNRRAYFARGEIKEIEKEENILNWSIRKYLNEFSKVFNANYRIRNGVLKFERKDYFFLTSNVWLDLTDENVCFETDDSRNKAYLRLSWPTSPTAYDIRAGAIVTGSGIGIVSDRTIGDENKFHYDNIIEWNSPPSIIQKGEESRVFDEFEAWMCSDVEIASPADPIEAVHFYRDLYNEKPILLSLEKSDTYERKEVGSILASKNEYTFSFGQHFYGRLNHCYNTNLGEDHNLYQNFHFIDNPRNVPNSCGYRSKYNPKGYSFEVEVPFSCSDLNTFDMDNHVLTSEGRGTIERVEFNLQTRNVIISGLV